MLDSAQFLLRRLHKTLENGQMPKQLDGVYRELANVFELRGERDSAQYFRNKHFALFDSLFNPARFNKVRNDFISFEEYLTRNQIEDYRYKVRWQQWIIIMISSILLLVGISLFIINGYYRRLRRAHRVIIEKNDELLRNTKQTNELRKKLTEQAPAGTLENTDVNNERLLGEIEKVMSDKQVISNPNFSMTELARLVQSNTKYVSSAINNTYQKNFKSFLNERRIRMACERLRQDDRYTIQAIAEVVGYKSFSNFMTVFKREMGMTPAQYRRANRGDVDEKL